MEPKVLQQRIEESLADSSANALVTFRPMFGGILGYCDGKPFASLSDVGLAFKLGGKERSELLAMGGEMLRYEPNSPPSKQYVVIPATILGDNLELARWLDRSVVYAKSTPDKKRC